MNSDIKDLENKAKMLRRDVVSSVYQAKDGHPGPALSIADIVATLYFGIMNTDPSNPGWAERDRLVLSKGHACPVLYAALARKGYFSVELLPTLRELGSILQGHPDMVKTPGVDMTTGSLGHGIASGAGMVAASRVTGKDYRVFVICGDGEMNEGLIWESAISAAKMKLSNLTVFVDVNGYQSGGSTKDVSGISSIGGIFDSIGWHVQNIDGHNISEIVDAIELAKQDGRPSAIMAKTVKGKGVSFMENNNKWHKGVPTDDEYNTAMKELG